MSFVALLEVVSASVFAWLLPGEALTPLQFLGRVQQHLINSAVIVGVIIMLSHETDPIGNSA